MTGRISRLLLFIFVSGAIVSTVSAQAPDTLWTRTYNCPGYLEGYSIRATSDNGFAIGATGCYPVSGNGGAFLLKLNSSGDTIWTDGIYPAYGGAFNSIEVTSYGTILAAGWMHGMFGGVQSEAYAYYGDGDRIWEMHILAGPSRNGFTWVESTADDGFVLTDNPNTYQGTYYDIRVSRADSSASILWTRIYGGVEEEKTGAARPDIRGGFIVAGSTSSFGMGSFDGYLIRINEDGDTLWSRTYGGPLSHEFQEIVQAPDSGYVIVGSTSSFGFGASDIFVVKTNSLGDTIWTRTFGTELNDYGRSVDRVPSGGYVVAAICGDSTYSEKAYLIRINDDGDTLWTKVINPDVTSRANSVVSLSDSGFIFTGCIIHEYPDYASLWIVRLGAEVVGIHESEMPIPGELVLDQNYPNPFNSSTRIGFQVGRETSRISLKVYDVCGRLVSTLHSGQLSRGVFEKTWDGRDIRGHAVSSGVYFCVLENGSA